VSGGVVAVVQARTGSTRLPGKVTAPIAGVPLVEWTLAALRAVPSIDEVVLAIPDGPEDDALANYAASLGPVFRGSTHDVLDRVWRAAAPFEPLLVVRGTADNPFPDPALVAEEIAQCRDDGLDYVRSAGYPLGIGVEVARFAALGRAAREAREPAEREHVMPYLYDTPGRFATGEVRRDGRGPHDRFTVDTDDDLALARAVAERVGHGAPIALAELEAVIAADPSLTRINAEVRQKAWTEVEA
jgi:spore coat polysaccharide biosynthesis protein SpsF